MAAATTSYFAAHLPTPDTQVELSSRLIRRYRLHELLERLNSGDDFHGAQLALDLGYADQAHLINDFRALAGYSPSQYIRRALPRR